MNIPGSSRARLACVFIFLSLFACAPIWGVRYFINQDGSGHVHGAWMMIELMRGNPRFTDLFQFNFIFFPDVAGHWLMALLLLFVSAFTATKMMMTLTYIGLVAAVGWLRWCTVGRQGLLTSFLIGGALAFNWLWLEGFYNFNLGFALAVFTCACYFRWREDMTFGRAALLALLLFLVFVSHVVSFAIAAGTIAFLCVLPLSDMSRRRLLSTIAAFVPVAPIAAIYKLSNEASGTLVPVWRNLNGQYALSNWLTQLRGIDSFIIISRRSFPFVDTDSTVFAVFTPVVWIAAAYALLLAGTWIARRCEYDLWTSRYLPFFVLAVGSIIVAIFSPDNFEFSSSTGGVLRERIFLVGLIFLVPIYRADGTSNALRIIPKAALVFVIAFQTAALWEYAIRSDRDAHQFLSASAQVPEGSSLAAITIEPKGMRFSSSPVSSMDNYIGIGRNILVWDNYEFGHYLFPVVAKNGADQEFVLAYAGNNTFELNNPERFSAERISKLTEILSAENHRIDTLLVWGSDPRIEAAYKPWFEAQPYFENGRVRLYRHK
jgi:hypothetical protein